ncbi:MAG TPA: efflux RND transporter periplasmic adaptor subunit [Pseudolabrys sp.]|nr:efflux RND transporter periplasmic adaptor subunit [Pseudolabrys sp.]
MRWAKTTVILAAGVVIIGAAFLWLPKEPLFAKRVNPPSATRQAIPVTAGTAEAQDVPLYTEGLGTVQAFNLVTVKTRVDGQITQVFFREGQEVKKGDRLFQIDPRPYENALQQAEATKEKDEAQLQSAKLDLERFAQLLPQGFQTRQSYDQQKATVGQLEAALKADEAQIATARLNLDYSTIRSPIDGRTGQRAVDIGNFVQTSQNVALVTITETKPIYVSFSVPAEKLDEIRKNQAQHPLKVIAYAMDDKTALTDGELTLIDNQVDVTTGTIRLKAQFANAGEPLWPGEFVNARLILSMQRNVVTVPAQTVMQGPNGAYVYTLDKDNVAKRKQVTVGTMEQGVAVIDNGLTAGERVVVEGQYRLTDGSKVKTGESQAASADEQAAR